MFMTWPLRAKRRITLKVKFMQHPLVLPMLLQIALGFVILLSLAPRRLSAVKKAGGVKGLRKAGGFSQKLINHSDNFTNQFEIPVFFFALCLLFIATGTASQTAVIAAWVFVVSRIVHTLIQTTNNVIFPNRFVVFLVGVISLLVMLGVAIVKAL